MDANVPARARGSPDEVVIVIVIVGKEVTSQESRIVAPQVCNYCIARLRRRGGWAVLDYGGRAWLGLEPRVPVRSVQSRG